MKLAALYAGVANCGAIRIENGVTGFCILVFDVVITRWEYNNTKPALILTVGRTSLFYPFRGVEIWGPGGFIVDGVPYPDNSSCAWKLL
ncbi:MAG: hypothetical protein CVV37_02320 [Nitrospira bacterium HGW-Nitrospira-1]|nr:MAG: hypothetical protein CVV37_02320 [Nitrospira bacterium HGW-Nitrospira-1]